MKNNKQKKSFILFISVFTAAMLLFSFSSCEFFSFSELPEVESQENIDSGSSASHSASKASKKGKIKLSFNPHFQNKEQSSGRSAYPEFSSAQLKNLKYTIEGSAFEPANGSYNETDGTIDFEISCDTFFYINVTIYAKNESDQILFYATTELTYSTIAVGAEITSSIYFKPYDSTVNLDTPPNGFINLQISTNSGYTIDCEIENNEAGKITVTNNSSNKCTISTVSGGVSPRDYKAKIAIKSGSNIVDFRIQTIYVWPGMTTDCWYLSNGEKSSNYSIEVNSCQLYVKGENPTGLYSDAGLPAIAEVANPSDVDNDGTILKPLQTINAAIAKCANDNKTYIIICDGDLPGFTIGASNQDTASKRKLTIKGGGNSDNYSKITSNVSFYTTNNIIFENLQFSNLSGTYSIYGTFFTNSGKKLALNNCRIENDTNANIGIGCNGPVSYSLELNDTTISCTKRDALNLNTNNATSTKTLRIKGSTFIEPSFDETTNQNTNSIVGPTKIIIDGPLTDSHTILGAISLGSGYEPGYQLMTAVNGANLAKESRRFEVIDFPKILNTDGKVEKSKDFYVAASDVTPAGSSSGTGSANRPLDTVTAAVAKINDAANSADGAGAGDYTIHISGLIKENDTINLVGSSGGSLESFYINNSTSPSTLTLCGTNKDNDKLDGNGSHQVLKIQGNPSYSLPVTIENLTIQNGNADTGGGIYVTNAIVKLGNGCVITQNENSSSGGGGVYLYNADLFMYGDALIGYDADQVYNSTSDAKTKGGNIAAGNGAAIYAGGTGNGSSPSKTNIWIGYTAENVPDTDPDKFPKISGNCSAEYGGAIYVNSYSSLYMCKGEISYNYAQRGGGLYAYYRSYAHFYRNFYGGLIKGNQAQYGGGICLTDASGGSAGFLHLSGDTVIEENEAIGAYGKGGAIYGASEIEIKDSVYIPFIDNKKNDVYLPQNKKIKILDTLTPPAAANGITATLTPETYSDTTVLLKDSETDAGTKVAANYDKFAVTPEPTSPNPTPWEMLNTGYIQKGISLGFVTITSQTTDTFDGTTGINNSKVFLSGRNLGRMNSLEVSDHEITQGEYEKYMTYYGVVNNSSRKPSTTYGLGKYIPAYNMCWYEAIMYCNLRSKAEDLTPAYYLYYNGTKLTEVSDWADISATNISYTETDGIKKYYYNSDSANSYLDYTSADDSYYLGLNEEANGWRLPLEMEWEWLARDCDLTNTVHDYSGSNTASDVGWTSGSKAREIKGKNPNLKNIYDMSGNVAEWCWDNFANDNTGLGRTGAQYCNNSSGHPVRGGSYSWDCKLTGNTERTCEAPDGVGNDLGFRIVRTTEYFGPIGNKMKPDTVGDIVFNDGSAMAYSDYTGLDATRKNAKKAAAIALIFYKGNELNNGDDTSTRILGVGLQHSDDDDIQWCTDQADAYRKTIDTFINNGKNNFTQLANFSGVGDSLMEDKYPAFYFAINYASHDGTNILSGSQFENEWYLPSQNELSKIYVNGKSDSNIFDIDQASYELGGDKFDNHMYWASCQNDTMDMFAKCYEFEYARISGFVKTAKLYVCAIREF